MKNKGFVVTYILAAALLIIALAVGYYFVIALPKIQSEKQALETKKFELERNQQSIESEKQSNYESCDKEANERAADLLKSKIEIGKKSGYDSSEIKVWEEASAKGLFLKEDYNALYDSCIRRYGLEKK